MIFQDLGVMVFVFFEKRGIYIKPKFQIVKNIKFEMFVHFI